MTKPAENPKEKPELASSWSLLPKSAALVRQYFVPLLYVSVLPALLLELGSTVTRGLTTSHASDGYTTTTASLSAHPSYNPLSITLIIIGLLWSSLSLAARYYVQLRAVDGQPVDVAEAYRKTAKRILPMIGLTIVYSALVLVGLVLLIVPGFIMIRRYFLAPYYLIDRDVSIRKALQLSAEGTKPVSGYIWGVLGVTFVLALVAGFLGSIPLGIGAILATFIDLLYVFAPAFRYKEISQGLRPSSKGGWSPVED